MTREEKDLLLKDLCARLPYGVVCDIYNQECAIREKLLFGGITHFANDTISVRPYLRPMSSMTEEEIEIYHKIQSDIWKECGTMYYDNIKSIDWLNAHHFDYRGLIEKGLAIAITEENNPYKD